MSFKQGDKVAPIASRVSKSKGCAVRAVSPTGVVATECGLCFREADMMHAGPAYKCCSRCVAAIERKEVKKWDKRCETTVAS